MRYLFVCIVLVSSAACSGLKCEDIEMGMPLSQLPTGDIPLLSDVCSEAKCGDLPRDVCLNETGGTSGGYYFVPTDDTCRPTGIFNQGDDEIPYCLVHINESGNVDCVTYWCHN